MPLESLRQPFDPEQAGHKLREVQVEHEPQEESPMRERFEALKKSDFYDQKKNWWREWDSQFSMGLPETQLLGVALEATFDAPEAEKQLQALRGYDKLFDQEHHLWYEVDPDALGLDDKWYFVSSELLEVFALARMDKQRAREQYENLKKRMELFDVVTQEWFAFCTMDNDSDWETHQSAFYWDKALDTILHKVLNYPDAGKMYKNLKSKERTWLDRSTPQYVLKRKLEIVLVESYFNPESAQKMFSELKKTEYSSERNEWGPEGDRRSFLQLLPLLIEHQLSSQSPKLPQQRVIPEERNF